MAFGRKLISLLAAMTLALPLWAQEMGNVAVPDDPEGAYVYRRCTRCHIAENFHDKRLGWIGWQFVVARMQVLNGGRFEEDERARILAYLLAHKRASPIWEVGEVLGTGLGVLLTVFFARRVLSKGSKPPPRP